MRRLEGDYEVVPPKFTLLSVGLHQLTINKLNDKPTTAQCLKHPHTHGMLLFASGSGSKSDVDPTVHGTERNCSRTLTQKQIDQRRALLQTLWGTLYIRVQLQNVHRKKKMFLGASRCKPSLSHALSMLTHSPALRWYACAG